MEKSEISWALVGSKSKLDNELTEDHIQKMLAEAFLLEKNYQLFLYGIPIEKTGSLEEMEEGYQLMKTETEKLEIGEYGIISDHEEGNLLFIAIEINEET